MRRQRMESALLCALTAALLLCGCAPTAGLPSAGLPSAGLPVTDAAGNAAAALTLKDMAGREVTLAGPAKRVAALTAADVEILYAVGAGDTLCARGEYCDYPAEALSVPSVQSGTETNVERILALKPDAVVMSVMDQTKEQTAAIAQAGIPVIVTDAQNIAGVYEAITLLGALTGHASEAGAVIEGMQDAFAKVKEEEQTGKSVYFEVSPLEYGLWTSGSGTFMDELAQMLGLRNAFDDVTGWAEISEEQVIARRPDYIVTITMYFGEGPSPAEEIASRPGWAEIPAVKDGHVFLLDSNAAARPGPRLAEAAEALYAAIYGADAAENAA